MSDDEIKLKAQNPFINGYSVSHALERWLKMKKINIYYNIKVKNYIFKESDYGA